MSGTSGDSTGVSGTTMAAGHWEFPIDCGADFLESQYTDAAADTFFLNEIPAGPCDLKPEGDVHCQDMEFSLSGSFRMVRKGDPNLDPLMDHISVYAVRFAMPTPKHAGNIPIPTAAFLAVQARIHAFRPFPADPWVGAQLNVRHFAVDDTWTQAQGYDFTPCFAPAASYRCRECTEAALQDGPCKLQWGTPGVPYDPKNPPIQLLNLKDEPDANTGIVLPLQLFTKEDLLWLTTEGLMVMPAIDTSLGTLEVKTLESGMPEWFPGLRVRYCEPVFVAD